MSFNKNRFEHIEEDENEEEFSAETENELDDFGETFDCKYCEFQTENVEDLDEHIITHEDAILDDSDEETLEETFSPVDGAEYLESSRADVNFELDKATGKIIKQELPAFYDEFAKKTNKKVFVCPFCGYQSMKKLDMLRHVQKHKTPIDLFVYACSECSYTTRRKCDMPKHLLTHCEYGSVPMYSCPECTYATKRKGDLSKHMLCHTKSSTTIYSCTECPYSSRRQGDLKKHLISHENEGVIQKEVFIYNCTECGYTSKRLNDLHKHAALHCDRAVKGVFKCPKCDYASVTGSHFARHILSHCKYMENAVTICPKDNLMEEYIVLEEDLPMYKLEQDHVSIVEVLEEDVDDTITQGRPKRKSQKEHYVSKKSRVETIYFDSQENDDTKVVVLPGYEDNDQNEEC